METNFYDEEHFGAGLYENQFLDDSQRPLLDIIGDDSRHTSTDYSDRSIIWKQDVEQELNGDWAVSPMCTHMDFSPPLSSSPPAKNFHEMYSDWQDLAPCEATLPANNSLVSDTLDCILLEACNAVLPDFDFSQTKISKTEHNKSASPISPEAPKMGGKDLDTKKELDLDNLPMSEISSFDELQAIIDNFDITSYVNGDDYDDFGEEKIESVKELEEGKEEDGDDDTESKVRVEKHEDSEEHCCVDVETVSEQVPVLQALDINSLWDQFEANEAVNPQPPPQNRFEKIQMMKVQPIQPSPANAKRKQPTETNISKPLPEGISEEPIKKMKTANAKKAISVIPAMPCESRGSLCSSTKAKCDSIQVDHDYCSSSGATAPLPPKNDASTESATEHLPDRTQSASDNDAKIKMAINKENACLPKNQCTRNRTGKRMISVLKRYTSSGSKSPQTQFGRTPQMRGNSDVYNKYKDLVTRIATEVLKVTAKPEDGTRKRPQGKRTIVLNIRGPL